MATAVLPYAGTSGWSGTETSRDAAVEMDKSGATANNQEKVLTLLSESGDYGATVSEVKAITGIQHHGSASSALTTLHAAGKITRLVETRKDRGRGNKVYVLPENVNGRAVEPYVSRGEKINLPPMTEQERTGLEYITLYIEEHFFYEDEDNVQAAGLWLVEMLKKA